MESNNKFSGVLVGLIANEKGEPHVGLSFGEEKIALNLECANLLFNQIGDILDSLGFFDRAQAKDYVPCQTH
jgi:hypothetical protein